MLPIALREGTGVVPSAAGKVTAMTRVMGGLLAAMVMCACVNSEGASVENLGEADGAIYKEIAIYRPATSTDVSWWTHDDVDAADETYLAFTSQTYQSGEPSGVYVDLPDCQTGDTFTASFDGLAKGTWQYRASLRMTVTQNGETFDVHGAQAYLFQPVSPSDVKAARLSGVFTVPGTGGCRVSIKGKTFSGALSLFGGAALVVTRHR